MWFVQMCIRDRDIDKTDIAGNLLPGATLTIRDANDEVVETWTTNYKTHRVPISNDFLKLSGEAKEYRCV